MRTDEAFYNIFMYLYNKNVLEYAQIARNETESRIPYIEGCSNKEPYKSYWNMKKYKGKYDATTTCDKCGKIYHSNHTLPSKSEEMFILVYEIDFFK